MAQTKRNTLVLKVGGGGGRGCDDPTPERTCVQKTSEMPRTGPINKRPHGYKEKELIFGTWNQRDARQLLGIRGWRSKAANRDEWRRLMREAKVGKGL